MDNVGEQVHSIEQFLTDIQHPWEYPTDICCPSYAKQPQSLLANSHSSPLPSPATAERLAVPTGHFPYGSLHTPSATGSVDFSMASDPWSCQLQWSEMSSNSAHETHASVPPLQNQQQTPYGPLCSWSRDFEPHPALPVPYTITSIPQSLSPMVTHSYQNVGQYYGWTRDVLDGSMDICASSPDGDTGLSTSDFLGVFADQGFLPDARADPQVSIALTHDVKSPIQSAAFPYNEPTRGLYRQAQFFECQWLTPDGALCDTHVNADRRSVVAHLQHVHGIKPGEEKAREICLWEQCGTILNKESLARHILTVHFKGRVHCAECGQFFAREDSLKRHLKGGHHEMPPDKNAARQPSRNHVGFR